MKGTPSDSDDGGVVVESKNGIAQEARAVSDGGIRAYGTTIRGGNTHPRAFAWQIVRVCLSIPLSLCHLGLSMMPDGPLPPLYYCIVGRCCSE